MSTQQINTVLITGASSGIGYTTAQYFCARGWQVFGLSRSGRVPEGVIPLRASVADPEAVTAAVDELLTQADGLQAVVHAAGIGGAGSIEDFSLAEAKK